MRDMLTGERDGLSGLRIAALPRRTEVQGKAAESANLDPLARRQGIAHDFQQLLDGEFDVLRRQAKAAAEGWIAIKKSEGKRPARVLGLLLDGSKQPRFMAFTSEGLAEEWFERVTGDPSRFEYAAYYDTEAPFAPVQLAEAAGGRRGYL